MDDTLKRIRDVVTSRWFVKSAFLIFFVYSVVRLLQFERAIRAGIIPGFSRPEAVGGMLPIGHFTSFFAWVRGGGWDTVLPAGLVLIIMSLTVSFLFKRAFCGWVCPVGTIWEAFALFGRKAFGRNFRLPRWLDLIGRGFRYLLAAAFMGFLLMVPISEAAGFRDIPYMWTADLKILHLMTEPAWLIVALSAAIASIFLGPVWCRYLCPLGGLYSAVGVLSPCTVERNKETCIHCHKCSDVCHGFVEPEKTGRVYAPECDGCMDCVKVCPVEGCLEAKAVSRVRIAPWAWAVIVVALWLAIWGFAKVSGNWDNNIPMDMYRAYIQSGALEQKTPGFGSQPPQ